MIFWTSEPDPRRPAGSWLEEGESLGGYTPAGPTKGLPVGSVCKVINPLFFARVGYYRTSDHYASIVSSSVEIQQALAALHQALSQEATRLAEYDGRTRRPSGSPGADLGTGAARALGSLDGLGGVHRRISWELQEHHLNKTTEINEVFSVKTGEYYPAGGWGEDWCPGWLDKVQVHRIARTPLGEIPCGHLEWIPEWSVGAQYKDDKGTLFLLGTPGGVRFNSPIMWDPQGQSYWGNLQDFTYVGPPTARTRKRCLDFENRVNNP